MMPCTRSLLAAALLIGFTTQCHEITAPEIVNSDGLPIAEQVPTPGLATLRVATLQFYNDSGTVELAATTNVGQSIDLRFTTYSGGCISDDTISVSQSDVIVDIVPYQKVYTTRANEACTTELRVTRRVVPLVFRKVGVFTVRVTGRSQPNGALLRLSRTVKVN